MSWLFRWRPEVSVTALEQSPEALGSGGTAPLVHPPQAQQPSGPGGLGALSVVPDTRATEPLVLARTQLPGGALTARFGPCSGLSPIAPQRGGAAALTATVLPGGRSFLHPSWVRVTEASRYYGASGERGAAAANYAAVIFGLSAAGNVPLPVGAAAGRTGGCVATRRESEASEAAEFFHVEAATVEVALDVETAPISLLFVREALRLLPEAPDEPGALERATEFLRLTGPYVSRSVHLGGVASGRVEASGSSSRHNRHISLGLQAQLDAFVRDGPNSTGTSDARASKAQRSTWVVRGLHVHGGGDALQRRGLDGLDEWLESLKAPCTPLVPVAAGPPDAMAVHAFLHEALHRAEEELSGSRHGGDAGGSSRSGRTGRGQAAAGGWVAALLACCGCAAGPLASEGVVDRLQRQYATLLALWDQAVADPLGCAKLMLLPAGHQFAVGMGLATGGGGAGGGGGSGRFSVVNATREAIELTIEARPASAPGCFGATVDGPASGPAGRSYSGSALPLPAPLVLPGLAPGVEAEGEVVVPAKGSCSVMVSPGQQLRFRLGGGGRATAALVTAWASDGGPLCPPRVLFEHVPVEAGNAYRIGE